MARVDLKALDAAFKKLFDESVVTAAAYLQNSISKSLFGGPRVRPGRYTKALWKKSGRPASLKAFARALEHWDPVVRKWLRGPPKPTDRQQAKMANFAGLYGGTRKAL